MKINKRYLIILGVLVMILITIIISLVNADVRVCEGIEIPDNTELSYCNDITLQCEPIQNVRSVCKGGTLPMNTTLTYCYGDVCVEVRQ